MSLRTTEQILDIFQTYRMAPVADDQYLQKGKAILRDKIESAVVNKSQLDFVMLGLPFKSINVRDKVLGVLPDLGEQLMMDRFSKFDLEIKKVYSPGARVTVVSDGYVFNDVLDVSDKIVDAYKEVSIDLAKKSGGVVEIYDLRDFYSKKLPLNCSRHKVMAQFGINEIELEREILINPDTNYLYRGMMRFMEEEFSIYKFPSKNQLHKKAKEVTRLMMMRNEAYSNLVRKEFSDYIRLSMHPSINNGAKYSFQLIEGQPEKIWTSPWHCAILVDENGKFETIHRKTAVEAGHELVYENGRAYNFVKK